MQAKLIALAGTGIIIMGLAAGLFYYKSKAAEAQATINTLSAKVEVLKNESVTLKDRIIKANKEVRVYISDLAFLSKQNNEINQKLQGARAKLAKRNLLKLRNSAHSEMVLKIINKSVVKKNKEWMAE